MNLSTQKPPKKYVLGSLQSLFIGVAVLIVVGTLDALTGLFGGSVAGVMLVSIICTGGMGLLIWIPVAYIIGTIILMITNHYHSDNDISNSMKKDHAIEQYILDAREHNMTNEEIRQNLLDAGWDDDDFVKYLYN